MNLEMHPVFTVGSAIAESGRFVAMRVDAAKVIASWRESLFAHEWLLPDGSIRTKDQLSTHERARREQVERAVQEGRPLDRPVLGIGIYDNLEIGAGRAVLLTLAALGAADIEVMVPIADYNEFAAYEPTRPAGRGHAEHGHAERGNVLYYILICIGLLAAINYAVATGSRSSIGSLTQDRQRLLATEMINYGDTLDKAISQLRLRGTTMAQLSFAATGLPAAYGTPGASPQNEVFNNQGGAAQYRKPPGDAMVTPGDYVFTAANGLKSLGTDCAAASCSELMVMAGPVVPSVCAAIDTALAIPGGVPAVTAADTSTPYAGAASYTATIGAGSGDSALAGRTAGCFALGSNNYFYQVVAIQ